MRSTTSTAAPPAEDLWHGSLSSHRLRTKERILHVAMDIIAGEGIAGLSMSALADGAGVSRQTLYKYFPDVDAVLEALAALGSAGLQELAGRIEAEDDPREGLRLFVRAVLLSAEAGHPSPQALTVALPASAREAMRSHEEAAQGLVIGLLRRGRAAGTFRADVDPELDGRFIYGATFAAQDLTAEPEKDVEALVAHVTRDLLRMVESQAPPASPSPSPGAAYSGHE